MLSIGILWVFLALMAAWGSFHFARHDPRSASLMKIGFAGSLLAATSTPFWFRGDLIGEGLLAHVLLLAFWSMIFFGVPLCFGLIVGTLAAMYRKR
ncbi:hypothetical protein [Nitrobacter sp. JJSN]|uniref:hypothetical protein n=1 Tax=Nitrobacter sp. JJSN TaxID=3453033 RepID=UPI003F772496